MSKALLLKRPSPFAYPGGNPGFDPSHVAANGCQFSAIAVGANAVNLLNGKKGVVTSTITPVIDGHTGPCLNGASGTNAVINWATGQFGGITNKITMAAIVVPLAFTVQNVVVAAGASGSGWDISILTNGTVLLESNSGGFASYTSTKALSIGVPYFIAVSANAGTGANLVIVNLNTGQANSQFASSGLSGSSSTSVAAQWGKSFVNAFSGVNVSATMFSSSYMSMPQLLQWAQDPWSFWYP